MTFSDNYLIDLLSRHYAIDSKTILPLSWGADMNAALYKIEATDHSSYFVKIKPASDGDINALILELLQKSGVQHIIPPIKTIDGKSSFQKAGFCLTVYPFIEAVNGFSQKLTCNQWINLGKTLRQVHDFIVPSELRKQIREETYSPKWRQAVRALYAHIEKGPVCKDVIAEKFLNFMKEKSSVIHRLIDRAEKLCALFRQKQTRFVLCHSDIHGGNVLLKGTNDLFIVDWDQPVMAPKERDLMFIGGGVGNVWNDPKEESYFYKGYGNVEIDLSLLAYYRYERIVEDIAEYGQALLFDTDHQNRAEMYRHFADMFAPNGVVEIAFKTDAVLLSRFRLSFD